MGSKLRNIIGLCLLSFLGMGLALCKEEPKAAPPPTEPEECQCEEKTHLNPFEKCDCPYAAADEDEEDSGLCDCTTKITTTIHGIDEDVWIIKEVGVLEEEFNIFVNMFTYGLWADFVFHKKYAFEQKVERIYVQKGAGIQYHEDKYNLVVGCDADGDDIYKYLLNSGIILPLYFQ